MANMEIRWARTQISLEVDKTEVGKLLQAFTQGNHRQHLLELKERDQTSNTLSKPERTSFSWFNPGDRMHFLQVSIIFQIFYECEYRISEAQDRGQGPKRG